MTWSILKRASAVGLGLVIGACKPSIALDERGLTRLSKQYVDRFDHFDILGVDQLSSEKLNRSGRLRFYDRAQTFEGLISRARAGYPKTRARTWREERSRLDETVGVFTAVSSSEAEVNDQGKTVKAETIHTMVWAKEASGWRLLHWQVEDGGLESERAAWNEVFRQSVGFNLKPNKFLMAVAAERTPGTVLDVGVGQGRNALYLASKGWSVTGIDIADEGVRQTQLAAEAAHLKIEVLVQDAMTYDWGIDRWDMICLIYEGGGQYADKVMRALKPGGVVVVEYFLDEGMEGTGASGFKPNQILKVFEGLKTLRHEELMDQPDYSIRQTKLVRYVGQKP